jgi:glycosyltransferase involved in cell wall biosynthesis
MRLNPTPTLDSPIISVITPTKNRLSLLCETMDSLARQDWPHWEHIIVDDGSNDGSIEEVKRRAAVDPRFRLYLRDGPVSGANICRNIGARNSRGHLLVFLDSDDLLEPRCLRCRAEIMERNADLDFAVWQTGAFEKVLGDLGRDMSPQILGNDLLRFLFMECPWQTTAPIWRKEALRRAGSWDELLPSWQDVDLHIRAICMGLRYLRFPEVDHHMRWQFEETKVSVMQRRSPKHLKAALGTLEKFERIVDEGPGMDWSRQRAICGLYYFLAEKWIELGSLREALVSWRSVKERSLASSALYWTGVILLFLLRILPGSLGIGARLSHKWKGIVRFRSNPELIPS